MMILGLWMSMLALGAENDEVEILWDRWGVPHVFATSEEAMYRGYGWAQTHSHGDLLLRLLGEARGRASEYWGASNLDQDRWIRTMGVPERALEWWEAIGEWRRNLEAFADGINTYVAHHPDAIDDSMKRVLPIHGVDLLAHAQRVTHLTFVTNVGAVSQARGEVDRGGSNAWAISPDRTESGHAMLLANPHLQWRGLFTFYEAHLRSPGFDAYGTSLVGAPVLNIGFNEHLGWTHTVNTHDGADLYRLILRGDGYEWEGEERAFTTREVSIKVRRSDGSVDEEPLTIKESVHGPVVAMGQREAIALRVAGLDRPETAKQWHEMAKAGSFEEFESALRLMQLPMFTVMYADREGTIMHLFGGLTPIRSEDHVWSGVVPGSSADTLWTEYHGYDELPQLVDPEAGWLQNANDPPWTTTYPVELDPMDYPSYMAPSFMHPRAQRSARLLIENESFTLDALREAAFSTRVELADRLVDDLVRVARASDNDEAKRVAEILDTWDRCADAESQGAVLFEAVAGNLGLNRNAFPTGISPFAENWDQEEPLETPFGLGSSLSGLRAMESAAATLEARYGRLDVPWGDVHRLRRDGVDLPAFGGPGPLGLFPVLGFRDDGTGTRRAISGNTFVAVMEFAERVDARVVLTYGNASQKGSPHRADQLPLYAKKQMRKALFTDEEILAELKSRETLPQGPR